MKSFNPAFRFASNKSKIYPSANIFFLGDKHELAELRAVFYQLMSAAGFL